MKQLLKCMYKVIRLDHTQFEEIVLDPTSQGKSIWAMAIFAMATAFGSFGMLGGAAVNIGLITTMIAWYVWAFCVFYVGSRFFQKSAKRADRKTIMRVVAFACAPGVIRLLGIIPKITLIILVVSSIWILIAAIIGLKKVFAETGTFRVAALAVVTWMAASFFQAILIVTLLSVFGVSKNGS